jgi:leucyl-tRNA synthetase
MNEVPEDIKLQCESLVRLGKLFNPDDVIDGYGADAMRLYEMFMGPLEMVKPWQMSGVEGVSRFLSRVHRLVVDDKTGEVSSKIQDIDPASESALRKLLHQTIRKVAEDVEALRFNTAISQMMVFANEATSAKTLPSAILRDFLKVVCPFAPHLAEELWEVIGGNAFLSHESWPVFDPSLCEEDTIEIAIQVNGKLRDTLRVPKGASKEEIEKLARTSEKAVKFLEGEEPKRVIVVPGRLVNLVTAPKTTT